MKSFLLVAASCLLLGSQAFAQNRVYGAIDLGARGVKAFLFSFEREGEGQDARALYKNEINTKLVSGAQNGRLTEAGIKEATQAVVSLIAELKTEAAKRKLASVEYYVVISSGVARFENKDELKTAVDAATGLSTGVVTAKQEGFFGLLSAVPRPRRGTSIMVDTGSSNTKVGCLEGAEFRSSEIPFGTVTARNAALKADADFKVGLEKVMTEQVAPGYTKSVGENPCLASRSRIYWIGGAAWATATFMHPEGTRWGYVNITKRDLDTFLARLTDSTWNQSAPVFRFAQDVPQARRTAIRTANLEERKRVQDVFSREDLLAGVSVMRTIMQTVSTNASVYFVRNGNYLFGYALEKYRDEASSPSAEVVPQAAPAVPAAGPTYLAGIDLGSRGVRAYLYSFVREGEGPDARSLYKGEINHKLSGSAQGNRFTAAGIREATSAVAKLHEEMKQLAESKGIKPTFYIVASSGVGRFENLNELRDSVKTATGLDVVFVSVEDEARYGLMSAVPQPRRQESIQMDIGGSNIKLGCLTRETFNPAEIPVGTVTLRNKVIEKSQKGEGDFASVLSNLIKAEVAPAYNMQRMNTPCLGNRDRVYAIGGATWAAATFTMPEAALWGYVPLSRPKIAAFMAQLNDGTWNQKEPVFRFQPGMAERERQAIREANLADRKRVQDVFSREDLLAGTSLLKSVIDQAKPTASIWFVRNGNYLFGYALEKYRDLRMAEDTTAGVQLTSAVR